mgnify:CR=1 FL=1
MITRRNLLKSGAAMAASSLALPALAQNAPIRIGYVSPLSGPLSAFSEADAYMIRKFEQAAAAQGLNILVVPKDSQSNPNRAADVARELIVRDEETGQEEEHLIPHGKHIIVHMGDLVHKGQHLTEGAADPHEILDPAEDAVGVRHAGGFRAAIQRAGRRHAGGGAIAAAAAARNQQKHAGAQRQTGLESHVCSPLGPVVDQPLVINPGSLSCRSAVHSLA